VRVGQQISLEEDDEEERFQLIGNDEMPRIVKGTVEPKTRPLDGRPFGAMLIHRDDFAEGRRAVP
jgi:transcription elongation GreA/GreB family factor